MQAKLLPAANSQREIKTKREEREVKTSRLSSLKTEKTRPSLRILVPGSADRQCEQSLEIRMQEDWVKPPDWFLTFHKSVNWFSDSLDVTLNHYRVGNIGLYIVHESTGKLLANYSFLWRVDLMISTSAMDQNYTVLSKIWSKFSISATTVVLLLCIGNIRDILGTATRNRNQYRKQLDAVSHYMQKFKVRYCSPLHIFEDCC